MMKRSLFFFLVLFVLFAGCAVEPEPFDGRRAYIAIEVYTTFDELMPPGLLADKVYATASYSSPWNPDGGAVPAVVVGIEDCRLKVNGVSIPDNDETWPDDPQYLVRDIYGDGYHWYKSQEPVTVYLDNLAYNDNLSPISLTIDLPSEDSYHYPNRYPRVQAALPFSDFHLVERYPSSPIAVGDTIQYLWDRSTVSDWNLRYDDDPDEGRLIVAYSTLGMSPDFLLYADTSTVDLTTDTLDVVIEDHGPDGTSVSLEVRFQLTTSIGSKTIDIVSGKQAWVDLREVREYVKSYTIE